MKRLTKILLINWHMFTCSEIDIANNVLITGHNGAGKSTLLDAVQYVLTGGKTKFNLAANEEGNRKLEGYVRGKLGTESQVNLRNGDVTTHVALQFYDEEEQHSFVLGSVIDLPESGKCRENFYIIYRHKADRELYIRDNGEILTKSQFDKNLSHLNIKYNFMQTKEEARRLVANTFNLNMKYSELIKKALAFKPISDLNDFMYRFLLPEERININSLRENVLEYRQFENTLKEQQERLNILEDINNLNREIEDYNNELKIVDYIDGLVTLLQNQKEKEELKISIAQAEKQLGDNNRNIKLLDDKLNDLIGQLSEIKGNMSTFDPEGRIGILQDRVKSNERKLAECEEWLNDTVEDINNNRVYLKQLSIDCDLSNDKQKLINDDGAAEALFAIRKKTEKLKDNVNERKYRISDEMQKINAELEEANKTIDTLKQKRYPYDQNVYELIRLLQEELSKGVGKTVSVKPFCEYLEITDEKWRNAVEGYLNTQRFDLFVEPEYFKRASRIYEQFKNERGIFGVGIVDTSKLEQYETIPEGSLAEKISTENIYARQYANMLLGKVTCEELVEMLNTHKQAITPSCMVYRNYAIRAINPRIYKRPFIGLKAIEIQLEAAIANMNSLKSTKQNIDRRDKDNHKQEELLNNLKLNFIDSFASSQQAYRTAKDDLDLSKKQLAEITKDPSWITLEEQRKECEERIGRCNNDKNAVQEATAEIKNNLENSREHLKELEEAIRNAEDAKDHAGMEIAEMMKRAEDEFNQLKHNARSDYNRMHFQINNRKQQIIDNKETSQRNIKDVMHKYNVRTSFGYEESLQEIDRYIEQYNKLRLIDIEKTINKTIEARKKCEKSFEEDFISTLRDQIERAKNNLKQLNRSLEDKSFQGDHYSFVYDASNDPVFSRYYKILCSREDYRKDTLFMEELSEQNRHLMDELFAKLVAVDNNEKNEQILRDYTDYRKYMKYDIQITHSNGDVTLFSKVNKEKSGGETQTPFYVIIAASFDQLVALRKGNSSGCLVLFDEAFNNMDEKRIEALMQFYKSLNIQLMIAVPEGRVRNIMPYVDTTLLLVKQNNQILSKEIIHED